MYVVYLTGLVGLTALATLSDVIRDIVPNYLILIGMVIGCFYQISTYGMLGLFYFVLGIIIPTLILFLLFMANVLGAGDIKLLSMLGGIMGVESVLPCILYSFILGGIISFFLLLCKRNFFSRMQSAVFYIQRMLIYRSFTPYERVGKDHTFHFTIPILLSVIMYLGGFY